MSVLIKGMEIPKSCWDCPCINGEDGYCKLRKEYVYGEVPRSCPLVPVPPHGRLIDAEGEVGVNVTLIPGGKCRVDLIAPTIIPAEEGE